MRERHAGSARAVGNFTPAASVDRVGGTDTPGHCPHLDASVTTAAMQRFSRSSLLPIMSDVDNAGRSEHDGQLPKENLNDFYEYAPPVATVLPA